MKMSKKALSAAITMSLVLGVYGVAGATDSLFGAASGNDKIEQSGKTVATANGTTKLATSQGSKYDTIEINLKANAKASDNNFTVTGGTWNCIIGGYGDGKPVERNTVTISGGTNNAFVIGGKSIGGEAKNNTVTISGGQVKGNVFGGQGQGSSGTASGNTINLGATDGSGKATIGGNVFINCGYDATLSSLGGGTLNVYSVGNTVGINLNADNVATVNFYIPSTAVTDNTMLSVTGTALVKGSTINTITTNYKLGETITLLKAGTLNYTDAKYQINKEEVTLGKAKNVTANIAGIDHLDIHGATYKLESNTLTFGTTDKNYYLNADSTVSGDVTLNYNLKAESNKLTINEDKSLTLKAGMETQGELDNSGTLTNSADSVMTFAGANSELENEANSGKVINEGTINFTSGAQLENESGASLTNNGTITMDTGTFQNDGTFQTSGTASFASVTGTGTTEVAGGTTTVANGFTQNGLTVASGASFEQTGGSFVVSGDVTNKGTVTLSNLGGSDVNYKSLDTAKNKITGKLNNAGTMSLVNTYLTVGAFVCDSVTADSNSLLYIIGSGADGSINVNTFDGGKLELNAEGLAKSHIENLQNTNVTVANRGTTVFDQAANSDAAFASVYNHKSIVNGQSSNVLLNEGRVVGASDFEYDANGKLTIHEKQNTHNLQMAIALGDTGSFARMEMNDIRKRLGDIRVNKAANGMWARYESGKNEGLGNEQNFNKFQIGGDTAMSKTWTLGGAVSYTKGDSTYADGSMEARNFSGAVYGVYTGSKGEFLDLVGRVGVMKHDVHAQTVAGDLNNMSFAISAEVGKTYDFAKNFYVEPQAEMTFTRSNGDDFLDRGVNYSLQDSNSVIGRVGFALGYKTPENKGQIYTRFSLLHEFSGDTNLLVSDTVNNLSRMTTTGGQQSWLEWAVGGQFNTSKATYLYVDAEKTFRADINERYRLNVGLRYSF